MNRLTALREGAFERILNGARSNPQHWLASAVEQAAHVLSRDGEIMLSRLHQYANLPMTLQPCVRDIWHDHILFVEDQVTGIVDFDALRRDHVAVDVARLAQSMIGNDPDQLGIAMRGYGAPWENDPASKGILRCLLLVNPLLSLCTWLEWHFVDRREFDGGATQQRILQLAQLCESARIHL